MEIGRSHVRPIPRDKLRENEHESFPNMFCPVSAPRKLFSHFCIPVNGGWSQWSPWSPCSSDPPGSSSGSPSGSCSQVRTRRCDDPAPANGGAECPGSSVAGGGDRQRRTCPAEKCEAEEQKGRMISNINKRSFFSDLCQFSFLKHNFWPVSTVLGHRW